MLKMTIATSVWGAQHPNIGRNIQQAQEKGAGQWSRQVPIDWTLRTSAGCTNVNLVFLPNWFLIFNSDSATIKHPLIASIKRQNLKVGQANKIFRKIFVDNFYKISQPRTVHIRETFWNCHFHFVWITAWFCIKYNTIDVQYELWLYFKLFFFI